MLELLLLARDRACEFEQVHGDHGPGTALLQELLKALDAHASSAGRRDGGCGCASERSGDLGAKLGASACALRGGRGGGKGFPRGGSAGARAGWEETTDWIWGEWRAEANGISERL